jgi:predicted RNase H-like nuclease
VRFLGIDLAWGEGDEQRAANRSGVVALEPDGNIVDAGWTIGTEHTLEWIAAHSLDDTLLFVDAPLVIANEQGQRQCEREVGQRYGRWKVAANSTNLHSPRQAGVSLLQQLIETGWHYDDGCAGPPKQGRVVSECYPYTAIVGVPELGFDIERPTYKRRPKSVATTQFPQVRALACDLLIARVAALASPPLDLASHSVTAELLLTPSPLAPASAYKQREDLLDAAICAWTASLWHQDGLHACQVLGADDPMLVGGQRATIIAPARPEQRAT